MMDIRDPSGDGIFDRNHAEIDVAGHKRGEAILERRAGHRLVIRIGFATGQVRIGAHLSLKNDLLPGHVPPRLLANDPPQSVSRCWTSCAGSSVPRPLRVSQPASILRAFSKSSGVSTPSGTLSTIITSIRMPASNARNCSSFSRR